MNNICITGRLTANPEIKTTTSGVPVCSLGVAVDRDYKVNGEKVTDFIPCVFWRGTAEFVEKYFNKGDMIALVGSLESRKWEDKEGNKRISWEVKVDKVNFCGKKSEDKPDNNEFSEFNPDDLPF